MNKMRNIIKYPALFMLIFLFGWESSSYYVLHHSATTQQVSEADVSPVAALSSLLSSSQTKDKNGEADLTTFWRVWRILADKYVDEHSINQQDMVYGAIKGMVSALDDPYTAYMTPDETKEFNQNLEGKLEGIGAELTVKDKSLVVVSPLKDSPAEKAGLKPEDIVYKIDGNLTSEMTLFDAIMKIRGPKGTNVTLTIIRMDKDEPFDITITRASVEIESVSMEDKKNGIFYISINQFNDNTMPEFYDKVNQLLLKEPKGLILDLRNNGGGYLDIAVDILSELLKGQKEAVTIKQRLSSDDETLYVSGKPHLADVPVAVLINHGSASASEIVAGAIQDHKRGILIGEQSFGKGSVQEVDKLSDGSSLRVTIAKWYTPKGNNIDKVGIKPDMIVEISKEDAKVEKDTQLETALKYLKDLKAKVK